MGIYDEIYYGDSFYSPSGTDVPTDLRFYRTNVDNVYVFHWGFDELFISPIIPLLDFELQLDTDPLFGSPNLVTFTSATAIDYQNGNVRKGFSVPVSIRQDGVEQTWYARVRTVYLSTVSAYSSVLQFIILRKFEVEEAENIIKNLPDYHVYGKEDLLRAVALRHSKLYTVADMYGKEFDQTLLENSLTTTNNYIYLCRDEQLFDNFGAFFNYSIPQIQKFVEYRMCLANLILGSLEGGTVDAIQRVVKSFTGFSPNIVLVRDREDFFLSTIFDVPPEVPDGFITAFSTIDPDTLLLTNYAVGTLVVFQNGVKLNPDTDYTENHARPGFDMTVAPSPGDVLQVFFDIGDQNDPSPVVFDITDKAVLTGSLSFINGSRVVSGVGTFFTTELQPGRLITDAGGLLLGIVSVISNDTSLLLEGDWLGPTEVTAAAKINFNGTTHLSGDITFTNSSTAITGVNSHFIIELKPGDTITDNTGTFFGVVDTITSEFALTLQSNWTGSSNTTRNARKLVYDDDILWDAKTLAYGVIIQVLNPGQFILDQELIERLTLPLVPAHVKVFFEFL